MNTYSYHIFYFPFKWELPDKKNQLLSEQVDARQIPVEPYSPWERIQISKDDKHFYLDEKLRQEREELFNEQQYYFDFVHPVLYDTKDIDDRERIISHYERHEPKNTNVAYIINHQNKNYVLQVEAMNLNIYSTGVGILSFYLINEREDQKSPDDIRNINQYGRRIMPPYFGDIAYRNLIAGYIEIKGLSGLTDRYRDDFTEYSLTDTWKPANFIINLLADFSTALEIAPVIDDRMFVNCWYGNNDLVKEFKDVNEAGLKKFVNGNFWYKYIFVDEGNDDTCQNDKMKADLLNESTYYRWQKYGSLYGVSKYSLVLLAEENTYGFLGTHMRTIYSRMLELVLVQRASMLKFSGEVTKVSCLTGKSNKIISRRIGSLYQEYIRFVNQVYFRNVTVQDQGVELYTMLMSQFNSDKQIKELDDEIGELHQYIALLIDQKRNDNGELLNLLAAVFLPATILTGLFGMNPLPKGMGWFDFGGEFLLICLLSAFAYQLIKKIRR